MHEAGGVSVIEGGGHAGADVAREFWAQPFLGVEDLAQALAFDELHHHGLSSVLFEHVVDGDDVRMVQARSRDGLAAEPLGHDGIGGE